MQDILGKILSTLNKTRTRKKRMIAILLLLSFLVSLDVFWILRKPGLTLAGDADCKKVEHTHNSLCGEWCSEEEHVHSVKCYSNDSSDVETLLDWQNLFSGYPYTNNLREDLVGIAKTQVGYSESEDNFVVGNDGKRRGYTRYGAWYGIPYSEWSAAFVSFCLNYAKGDLAKNPINSGAFSMMELWKKQGKFTPLGKYFPVSGDLVFFRDNTVGIVAEVYNSIFSVIKGDVEDSVSVNMVLIKDTSIVGWGITGGTFIDDGLSPVVKIEAKTSAEKRTAFQSENKASQRKLLSARTVPSGTELVPYITGNEGSHFITISDSENKPLKKDENGHYIVIENTGYKLTLSFNAPNGISPGTYWYQLPSGLVVDSGNGEFILNDGTNVGIWTVSDDGLITFEFNDNINSKTDIIISATMGAHFVGQNDSIKFDGDVIISVQKPPEDAGTTIVTKWGMQGNENVSGKSDPTKIYWNVCITGNKNSNIPGSIVSDKILVSDWTGVHEYTQSDMESGLKFGAADPFNPVCNWHAWTVYPGDPNLTWTKDGWTYIMPETVSCWCGNVTLGNEGWTYYVDYSSTPDLLVNSGTAYYTNRISADNHYFDSGSSFTGKVHGVVKKGGKFVTDANGSAFVWEIQAAIPGRKEGQKPDHGWYIADYLYLLNNEGNGAGYLENTAHLSKVTMSCNGTVIEVPRVKDATENDLFAWDNQWSGNQDGVNYLRAINLLHRCDCHGDDCHGDNWAKCEEYWYYDDDGIPKQNGFCQCWTPEEDVVFTFVYRTEDLSLLEKYGGLGYRIQNVAELYYKRYGDKDAGLSTNSNQSVTIPSIMKKELTKDFDGYTASYRITLNESKLNLTNGTPLYIKDEMTQTLAFISGSLVVSSEDINGNVNTLIQDVDYTVTYDGSGNKKDDNGNVVHVLDIVILNPQPVMYILDYDTTLIIPDGTTQAVLYSNTASVKLWGDEIKSSSDEKVYADINISAKSFKVEMKKMCSLTRDPLAGAVFGIFNENGGLIATDVTNEEGLVLFQTNIIEGIVLREHVFYYIQELKAPAGYKLDDSKFWFCFCDDPGETCTVYNKTENVYDAIRIPYNKLGHVEEINHLLEYDLPATGGSGVYPLILLSVIFIITPLVYRFIIKQKQKSEVWDKLQFFQANNAEDESKPKKQKTKKERTH